MALPVRRRETSSRPVRQWEPYGELQELQRRAAELLESAWSGTGGGDGAPWVPLADIEETDDAWIIEVELPGVRADDIEVESRDRELVITGDIKERERKGILRRRTRRTGRFEFRVTMPEDVDPDAVDASLDGGILTVRIPKPEPARPHRVAIRDASA